MKKKLTAILFFVLILIIFTTVPLYADNFENVFNAFLLLLSFVYEDVETLTMPEKEIHTVEGFNNEAMYMLTFKSPDDVQIFINVLREENIPFGTFPQRDRQVVLFYSDLIKYIYESLS